MLTGITDVDASYVLRNLREKSREECELQGRTPITLSAMLAHQRIAWTIWYENKPAALIGAMPLHRGVWSLFGFGTDAWVKVWRLVTLTARRDMMRAVTDTGAHRAQCLSPATHTDTHKWLRLLGASYEVDLPAYGVNGEDFKMFAWLKG